MTSPNADNRAPSKIIERWFLDLDWSRYLARCLNRGETPDERFRDNAASREQAQVWTEQLLEALSTSGFQLTHIDGGDAS